MELQTLSGFGIQDCLTEASLGRERFGTYNKDREFYTFNDKYVRDFIRKPIKRGRVAALNRDFESSQCEERLITIKKLLQINDNELLDKVDEYLKYISTKGEEFKLQFENGEKHYRKMKQKDLHKLPEKQLGELQTNKEIRKINKDDLLAP